MAESKSASAGDRPAIPVLKPLLPRAAALLPYLERIDATRVYSNWGPLVTELGERVAGRLGVPAAGLVCASSGMAALVAAVLATAGRATPERPYAIVPDYTFTASALAVQLCGYEPVLATCDRGSWGFGPGELEARPEILGRTAVVMPVAPYGRAVAQAPWADFQARTGVKVVIDGAACFDRLAQSPAGMVGPLPLVLSFHATKSFGTGEGGCVITDDPDLAIRVSQALNFGFQGSRESGFAGTNGKMSEYIAAVGLAELDGWAAKHAALQQVFALYRQAFAEAGIERPLWGTPAISCAYVLLECESDAQALRVVGALAGRSIDSRWWYGTGLQAHRAFASARLVDLHGERRLQARTLVGLPVAPDLAAEHVRRIAEGVHAGLRG